MKLPYKLEIIPDTEESGFVASYPELPGCITCGETIAEAAANAEDAKKEGVSMNQYCVYLLAKNSETEHASQISPRCGTAAR